MGLFSGLWQGLKSLFGGSADNYSTPGNRLYVGNLSYRVKEEELRSLFSKYGKVRTLHLIRDRLTRRLKGYAFIEMSTEDAPKSLELNGADFLGRKLVVSIAKSKQRPDRPERADRPDRPERPQGGAPRQNPSQGGKRNGPSSQRFRRRSGPKAYGPKGTTSDTPIQRYE